MVQNLDHEAKTVSRRTDTFIHFASIIAVSFSAGTLAWLPGRDGSHWDWSSPWALACLIAAGIWAGVVVVSLFLARQRSQRADAALADIAAARHRATELLTRIDTAEAQTGRKKAEEWAGSEQ